MGCDYSRQPAGTLAQVNYALGILFAGLVLIAGTQTLRLSALQRDLANLKASYATAAVSAVTHAAAVEAKQDAAIKTKTYNALSQASATTSKANASKASYEAKLAAIAKQNPKDLPHICANVLIPADLH